MTYENGGFLPSFKADYEQDGLTEDGNRVGASDCSKNMLCFGKFANSATVTCTIGRHITVHSLVAFFPPDLGGA